MGSSREFFDWFRSSGCHVFRNGNYDVSFDEIWTAYCAHVDGNDGAFDELDAVVMWDAQDQFTGREHTLSEKDLAVADRMIASGTVWGEVPDIVRILAERTRRDQQLRSSYEHRRERASSHIANPKVRKRIFKRDGYKCRLCHALEDLSIDHIVPVIAGGGDEDSNLQTLCRRCNSSKGGRQ